MTEEALGCAGPRWGKLPAGPLQAAPCTPRQPVSGVEERYQREELEGGADPQVAADEVPAVPGGRGAGWDDVKDRRTAHRRRQLTLGAAICDLVPGRQVGRRAGKRAGRPHMALLAARAQSPSSLGVMVCSAGEMGGEGGQQDRLTNSPLALVAIPASPARHPDAAPS